MPNRLIEPPLPPSLRVRITEYRRTLLAGFGSGTCLGAIALWTIFQGFLLPLRPLEGTPAPSSLQYSLGPLSGVSLFYLMFFGVAILSALTVRDFGKSILAFMIAYIVAGAIVYEVLSSPGLSAGRDTAFREILATLAISWTFTALFPVPLFIGLLGTVLGAGLEERFFSYRE